MNGSVRPPDFLVIGPQKTGSTSLFFSLQSHPQLVGPEQKELHFFNDPEAYQKGVEHYHSLFPPAQKQQLVFEATPNYFVHAAARFRIYNYNPALKLVYILRNPVHRFISQFFHFHALACKTREALANGDAPPAWEGDPSSFSELFSRYELLRKDELHYFAAGEYIVHLKEWEELFGKENMHCVIFDDFVTDPHVILGKLQRFLGVTQERLQVGHHNRKNDWLKRCPDLENAVTDEFVHRLYDHYRPFNTALYTFLGRDLHWEEEWL